LNKIRPLRKPWPFLIAIIELTHTLTLSSTLTLTQP
jgi:hypothetical protein